MAVGKRRCRHRLRRRAHSDERVGLGGTSETGPHPWLRVHAATAWATFSMLCTSANSFLCMFTLPFPRSVLQTLASAVDPAPLMPTVSQPNRCRATSATGSPRSIRAVVGLRGEQSAGFRPCTPCEGKTTQTPWSLPRALSSWARAGPRGHVLVRSIARNVVRVQASGSVGDGWITAPYGGRRERNTALPASSGCGEGPAIRLKPIWAKSLRVSLPAPAWHRCRAAARPGSGGAAAGASPAPSNPAPHSVPAPWLHA